MPPASIPYLLICLRLAAGLAMVALAASGRSWAAPACAFLLAAGVLSDIFDGVIARRIGSVTDRLRTLDSRCDLLFWSCATGAALILHPSLFASTWKPVLVLGALEATTHLTSYLRFRREASPHHLLSKLFGLGLWALLTKMLLQGSGGTLQIAVFCLGVASQLEALAITLLLPTWRCDVKGLRQAVALRRLAA